jgi:hypothetical protein
VLSIIIVSTCTSFGVRTELKGTARSMIYFNKERLENLENEEWAVYIFI